MSYSLLLHLEKVKLDLSGRNFIDWFCNVRTVLRSINMEEFLFSTPMENPGLGALDVQIERFYEDHRRHEYVHSMLCHTMPRYLSEKFMYNAPFETVGELMAMFEPKVRAHVFDLIKGFTTIKMTDDQVTSAHLEIMKEFVQELKIFGVSLTQEVVDGIILTSLPLSYEHLGVQELHRMLDVGF